MIKKNRRQKGYFTYNAITGIESNVNNLSIDNEVTFYDPVINGSKLIQ